MKTIGIFGTSGFAREVRDVAHDLGYEAIFVARDELERESWNGDEQVILESQVSSLAGLPFVVGIGANRMREQVFDRYAGSLRFVNLVHPAATFGRSQLRALDDCRGVVACAGARLMSNIAVGDGCVFSLNATIGHDSIVEDFVFVAPGANVSGNVHLKHASWIGTGAAINQGSFSKKLIVGTGVTVGSGAVVVRDCEDMGTYAGVPARKIK